MWVAVVETGVRAVPPADERSLADSDPEVAQVLAAERERQSERLGLIASENFVSRAVLEAEGTILTNRYAEGLPGSRYSAGCQEADRVEELARRRLQTLFGAEYANVQPHSGAQAVMAAYLALLRPGDTVLAMDPACGGHLTHGSPVHLAAQLYRFGHYGVDRDSERLDMDEVRERARGLRPTLIVAGSVAYPRQLDFAAFQQIAREVGARLMVDMAHIAGLVAGGVHPNPVPLADLVVTTTHKTLRGPRGGAILCRAADARAVDRAVFPGVQGGPLMHTIAAKAVAFGEAAQPGFADYQRRVVANARALGAVLADRGFRLVAGGTDTHLLIVDLRAWGLSGRQAERGLEQAGLITQKQTLPFDPLPPTRSSGLRLGTPGLTSRGMGEREMEEIGRVIADVLAALSRDRDGAGRVAAEAGQRVLQLCDRFPVPA